LDYVDLCKVAELMKTKIHLTSAGLEQIRVIKSGMNSKRKHLTQEGLDKIKAI